jgi:nicotine blue oxidoreductase
MDLPFALLWLLLVLLLLLLVRLVVFLVADIDIERVILRLERVMVRHGNSWHPFYAAVKPGTRPPAGYSSVVPTSTSIPAIVLAAGHSARMGEPKAGLQLPGGDTFIRRITTALTAGGAAPVLVVVSGRVEPAPTAAASGGAVAVEYVINPDPDRGQTSSLQCGLACVPDAPAVLVTLVDVPLVTAALVRALIEAWVSSGASVVRPTQAGRHGHPILIAQPVIRELLGADPSAPARSIIRRHAADGVELEVADSGPFLDVDTPEEYRRLIASLTVDR